MKKKGILERLKEGPVLGDGGYLLELEKRGWVRAGPFTPEVALDISRSSARVARRISRGRRRRAAGAHLLCQPRQARHRRLGKSPGRPESRCCAHRKRSSGRSSAWSRAI